MALSAQDLRIGNLVYYHIEDPMDERKEYDKIGPIDHNDLRCLVTHEDNSEYRPIPLSEEWLRKFGFSDKEYQEGFIGIDVNHMNFVLTKPNKMGDFQEYFAWEYKNDIWPKYNELKFIHELQNLFYCLTGEELVINEQK
jgi:hypothetical protein